MHYSLRSLMRTKRILDVSISRSIAVRSMTSCAVKMAAEVVGLYTRASESAASAMRSVRQKLRRVAGTGLQQEYYEDVR